MFHGCFLVDSPSLCVSSAATSRYVSCVTFMYFLVLFYFLIQFSVFVIVCPSWCDSPASRDFIYSLCPFLPPSDLLITRLSPQFPSGLVLYFQCFLFYLLGCKVFILCHQPCPDSGLAASYMVQCCRLCGVVVGQTSFVIFDWTGLHSVQSFSKVHLWGLLWFLKILDVTSNFIHVLLLKYRVNIGSNIDNQPLTLTLIYMVAQEYAIN